QLFREDLHLLAARREAIVNADVAGFRPSTLIEPLPECREAGFCLRIVLGEAHQHADPPHSVALLRARRERPRRRRAAEQRDELPSPHSITSSAVESNDGGTVRPSALAVLRLMTSSNLFGACTGRSAGFSPRSMRSTYDAARRHRSVGSIPSEIS